MSINESRIDSHKLVFFPKEVARWMDGEIVYPINLEVGLTGACNHRCIFCAYDYMEYVPHSLTYNVWKDILTDLREHGGGKSVLFAGTGEPLLHKDFCEIVKMTKEAGCDVALSTNGVLYTKEKAELCEKYLSWIRFSVSAGTEKTYKSIHRGKDGDFERVITNIADASQIKRERGLKTVLNVQIVMIPQNRDEILMLAKRVKEAGADRFIVKSFGTVEKTQSEVGSNIDEAFYKSAVDIREGLEQLKDDSFQTVFREERICNTFSAKPYAECYAEPFHAMIGSEGNVYPCCDLQGREEFAFGNVNEESFSRIWCGDKRKEVMEIIKKSKMGPCPGACKLDSMNRYLNELVHPSDHVNFI